MSVLVKGMKMPKSCKTCDLLQDDDGDMYCPFGDCPVFGDIKYVPNHVASDICPLVELPEKHGRLIDADAFAERIKSIIERQGYDDLEINKFSTVGEVLNAVIADLKGMTLYGYENAPTVIEAEGVDE